LQNSLKQLAPLHMGQLPIKTFKNGLICLKDRLFLALTTTL